MKQIMILVLCLLLAPFAHAAMAEPATLRSEEGTIRDTTNTVLEQLEAQRERLKSDPAYIQELVRELIVPHFDFALMSQLVMGRYWSKFDLRQQQCFIAGFRNMLVERYAYILLSYDQHEIRYDAPEDIGSQGLRLVRQTVSREGAKPLPIEYAMERMDDEWKVADLIIDGISLVRSHRGMFQSRVMAQGQDFFLESFSECADL